MAVGFILFLFSCRFQRAKVQIYTQNAKKMGFYFVIYPQSLTFATV